METPVVAPAGGMLLLSEGQKNVPGPRAGAW